MSTLIMALMIQATGAIYLDKELACTVRPEREALQEDYRLALEFYQSKECEEYRDMIEKEPLDAESMD